MQIPDTQIYLVQGASLYIDIGLHLALIFTLFTWKEKLAVCNAIIGFLFFRQ